MLALGVFLIILALFAWAGRAILAGLGAPPWLNTVVLVIALIWAVVIVAGEFGIATPSLR